jgi:hypothetical protein
MNNEPRNKIRANNTVKALSSKTEQEERSRGCLIFMAKTPFSWLLDKTIMHPEKI